MLQCYNARHHKLFYKANVEIEYFVESAIF